MILKSECVIYDLLSRHGSGKKSHTSKTPTLYIEAHPLVDQSGPDDGSRVIIFTIFGKNQLSTIKNNAFRQPSYK